MSPLGHAVGFINDCKIDNRILCESPYRLPEGSGLQSLWRDHKKMKLACLYLPEAGLQDMPGRGYHAEHPRDAVLIKDTGLVFDKGYQRINYES